MSARAVSTARKILIPAALARRRRMWDRRRRRVVFTNGVFDLLHPGHVEMLERARALGDVLVVGVNSDASAGRLGKGPGRPFNKLRDRARVLAALACVDAVVSFSADTPEALIRRLGPDILVKGADYREEEVAGRRFAGQVKLIPLISGYSTTSLSRRIAHAFRGC